MPRDVLNERKYVAAAVEKKESSRVARFLCLGKKSNRATNIFSSKLF